MPASNQVGGRSRRGSALVIALLVSVVLTVLITALLSTRVSELRAIAGNVRVTNAQLIAEAGVDYVLGLVVRDGGELEEIAAEPPYYYAVSAVPFADGEFAAIADRDDAGRFRVLSQGRTVEGTTRTVEVLLDLVMVNRVVRDFGLLTCGDLTLTGDARVTNGDVYAGGNLFVERATAVSNGDAMAKGNIAFKGQGSVTGNAISSAGSISLTEGNRNLVRVGGYAAHPVIGTPLTTVQAPGGVFHDEELYGIPDYCEEGSDIDPRIGADEFIDYANEALGGGTFVGNVNVSNGSLNGYADERYIEGNMIITGTPEGFAFSGVYFVTGDLTVEGNYAGSATFVVSGRLSVKGDTSSGGSLVDGVDRAYVVAGNVIMEGGAVIDGVVYTNGILQAAGGSTVNGRVVAIGDGGFTGSLFINAVAPGPDLNLPNETLSDFRVQRWRLVSSF